ncbi:hypothetical protein [Plasticicumulans acidivorans]|nr:hypothetical protein [Plasticicumulans acidivorans]
MSLRAFKQTAYALDHDSCRAARDFFLTKATGEPANEADDEKRRLVT